MHSGTAPAKQQFDPLTTMVAVAAVTARIEGVTDRLKDATDKISHLDDQVSVLRDLQSALLTKLTVLIGNGNAAVEPVIPRLIRKAESNHRRLDQLDEFRAAAEPSIVTVKSLAEFQAAHAENIKKIPEIEDVAKSVRRLRKVAWIVLAAFGTWVAQSGWQDVKPWVYRNLQNKPLAEETRR